jgi:hypothetical protein
MDFQTKICATPNCGEHPLTNFYFNRKKNKGKGVYAHICKECHKKKSIQYLKDNPEVRKSIRDRYNESHKEQILEYARNYDSKEVQKRFYEKNKKKIFASKKERRKNDPNFKLLENLRKRVYDYIKNKDSKSIEYLGCDINFYKQYLESQFDNNMSWDNYGQYWEIDHIISLFTYNFSNPSNIKEAFNYKNTRPLSITENRSRPKSIKL